MAVAARDLQDQSDPQHTLDTAVHLAVQNVDAADDAALSIVRKRKDKGVQTLASTADYVVKADLLQYELREGPCWDAIWEDQIVHSPDLKAEHRWPQWAPRVVEELGINSMLCFRLFTHEDTVGGLNLYAHADHAFDSGDIDDGLALAAHIAVAVVAAQEVEDLHAALKSRTVIGKAIGMIMERYDLSDERAFEVLARLSSTTNTKIRDLAEVIVARDDVPGLPNDEEPSPVD